MENIFPVFHLFLGKVSRYVPESAKVVRYGAVEVRDSSTLEVLFLAVDQVVSLSVELVRVVNSTRSVSYRRVLCTELFVGLSQGFRTVAFFLEDDGQAGTTCST